MSEVSVTMRGRRVACVGLVCDGHPHGPWVFAPGPEGIDGIKYYYHGEFVWEVARNTYTGEIAWPRLTRAWLEKDWTPASTLDPGTLRWMPNVGVASLASVW